jgi:hypothetical protein
VLLRAFDAVINRLQLHVTSSAIYICDTSCNIAPAKQQLLSSINDNMNILSMLCLLVIVCMLKVYAAPAHTQCCWSKWPIMEQGANGRILQSASPPQKHAHLHQKVKHSKGLNNPQCLPKRAAAAAARRPVMMLHLCHTGHLSWLLCCDNVQGVPPYAMSSFTLMLEASHQLS